MKNKNFTSMTANLSATLFVLLFSVHFAVAGPYVDPPNVPNQTQMSGFVRLTWNGTPPGINQWYWQGTSCGQSTTDSQSYYDVYTPGTYYLRAAYQPSTTIYWSTCVYVTVISTGIKENNLFADALIHSFNKTLFIDFKESNIQRTKIKVINLMGQELKTVDVNNKVMTVNLDDINSGVYLVNICNNEGIILRNKKVYVE